MSESSGIDSIFGGGSMPKPCSLDLRERVLETVESGASRREAAERFEVSASSAIKWMQRRHENRKRRGQADRGEHISAGGARGLSAGADCRATGFDAG